MDKVERMVEDMECLNTMFNCMMFYDKKHDEYFFVSPTLGIQHYADISRLTAEKMFNKICLNVTKAK